MKGLRKLSNRLAGNVFLVSLKKTYDIVFFPQKSPTMQCIHARKLHSEIPAKRVLEYSLFPAKEP